MSSNLTFVTGSSTTDYVPLVNLGGRFQFFSNGTLWIESTLPYDEGYYMCKSENGVGAALTKSILVSVNGKNLFLASLTFFKNIIEHTYYLSLNRPI